MMRWEAPVARSAYRCLMVLMELMFTMLMFVLFIFISSMVMPFPTPHAEGPCSVSGYIVHMFLHTYSLRLCLAFHGCHELIFIGFMFIVFMLISSRFIVSMYVASLA